MYGDVPPIRGIVPFGAKFRLVTDCPFCVTSRITVSPTNLMIIRPCSTPSGVAGAGDPFARNTPSSYDFGVPSALSVSEYMRIVVLGVCRTTTPLVVAPEVAMCSTANVSVPSRTRKPRVCADYDTRMACRERSGAAMAKRFMLRNSRNGLCCGVSARGARAPMRKLGRRSVRRRSRWAARAVVTIGPRPPRCGHHRSHILRPGGPARVFADAAR